MVCKALFRKVIAVFALSLGLIIVLGAAGCSDLPQGLPQSLLAWLSAESWVKPWDGESYTTSSIVPSADGSFMSLAPEDLVSAVVEIPAYPDKGESRHIALDLEKAEKARRLYCAIVLTAASPARSTLPVLSR